MKNLDLYIVKTTDSIHTAMEKITANKHRAVVVVDEGKVVGTVSDGDIRRALLREVLLISPVERIMSINCQTTTERNPEKQQRIIRQKKVTVLPVIDSENTLLDVALAYEPFSNDTSETE